MSYYYLLIKSKLELLRKRTIPSHELPTRRRSQEDDHSLTGGTAAEYRQSVVTLNAIAIGLRAVAAITTGSRRAVAALILRDSTTPCHLGFS